MGSVSLPMLRVALCAALLLLAACGGDDATTTTAPFSATTVTTVAATTTTTRPPDGPSVLAVVTGRGDDGSLEITVWFDAEPLVEGAALIVGIDSDDSYPGSGDVGGHLDGYAEFMATSSGVGVTLVSEGEVVAAPGVGLTESWLSWVAQDEVLRLFLVQDLTTRSGSVWVVVGDAASPLGTAGVSLGESCSYRGSGVLVEEPPGGVPDAPRTCRYPG